MKNTIQLTAFTAAALMMTASSLAAETFRLACPSAATSTTCQTADRFAELAREKSGGDLDIQVFPAGQLGSGEKAIQQMRAGVLDMVVESLSNYGNFNKDYNVVSWGFTFRSPEHYQHFLGSDLNGAMMDQLKTDQGIKMLAVNWQKLPRVVVSTKPVESPEDLQGLKFRVPGIPSYIATWSTLGTNPTQVPWADSFQALKTGITDAMESPLDSIASQKFHLAAPYVTLTNHVYDSITLAMNGQKWDGLDAEKQKILTDAAAEAAEFSAGLIAEVSAKVEAQLEADGATIIKVDTAPFAARLNEAAYAQEAEGLWSKGLYDKIQAIQ